MKRSLTYLLFLLIVVGIWLISCKKTGVLTSPDDYISIKINGVEYSRAADSGYVFGNQKGCISNKMYVLEKLGQVSTPEFFFHMYINYFQNNSDFSNSLPGEYSITPAFIANNAPCNLGIEVSCDSVPYTSTSSWILQNPDNKTYQIKSISPLSETSTVKLYQVIAEFSMDFKDSNNKLIPVTGKFQKTLSVLK